MERERGEGGGERERGHNKNKTGTKTEQKTRLFRGKKRGRPLHDYDFGHANTWLRHAYEGGHDLPAHTHIHALWSRKASMFSKSGIFGTGSAPLRTL